MGGLAYLFLPVLGKELGLVGRAVGAGLDVLEEEDLAGLLVVLAGLVVIFLLVDGVLVGEGVLLEGGFGVLEEVL